MPERQNDTSEEDIANVNAVTRGFDRDAGFTYYDPVEARKIAEQQQAEYAAKFPPKTEPPKPARILELERLTGKTFYPEWSTTPSKPGRDYEEGREYGTPVSYSYQDKFDGVRREVYFDADGNYVRVTGDLDKNEFLQNSLMLFAAVFLPGIGNAITNALVSEGVMTAGAMANAVGAGIANTAYGLAQGQTLDKALTNAIVGAAVQTGSIEVAQKLNLVIGSPAVTNAIVSTAGSMVKTAAAGGSADDIARAGLGGLVSSATTSLISDIVKDMPNFANVAGAAAGGAVVGGGGGAIMGALNSLVSTAAKNYAKDVKEAVEQKNYDKFEAASRALLAQNAYDASNVAPTDVELQRQYLAANHISLTNEYNNLQRLYAADPNSVEYADAYAKYIKNNDAYKTEVAAVTTAVSPTTEISDAEIESEFQSLMDKEKLQTVTVQATLSPTQEILNLINVTPTSTPITTPSVALPTVTVTATPTVSVSPAILTTVSPTVNVTQTLVDQILNTVTVRATQSVSPTVTINVFQTVSPTVTTKVTQDVLPTVTVRATQEVLPTVTVSVTRPTVTVTQVQVFPTVTVNATVSPTVTLPTVTVSATRPTIDVTQFLVDQILNTVTVSATQTVSPTVTLPTVTVRATQPVLPTVTVQATRPTVTVTQVQVFPTVTVNATVSPTITLPTVTVRATQTVLPTVTVRATVSPTVKLPTVTVRATISPSPTVRFPTVTVEATRPTVTVTQIQVFPTVTVETTVSPTIDTTPTVTASPTVKYSPTIKIVTTVTPPPPPPKKPPSVLAQALNLQPTGAYRGAGEIEDPSTGKKRRQVWNEETLRLKDALGV